ncbi:helix-turn-helix transcriptional regulator [Aestuariivirga sp.]|uniref:helix-turn-helix transcriptional regulator n=1 Tax=Aestuariivirga sp. TaxID=2650926 RepID=UPI0039E5A1DE
MAKMSLTKESGLGFFERWFAKRPKPSDPSRLNRAKAANDAIDYVFKGGDGDLEIDGLRVWLHYVDGADQPSERWVQLRRIHAWNNCQYLEGFCELRNEPRTFRLDGIVDVADSSGEIYEPVEFFAPYFRNPDGRTRHVIARIGDELRLLAFIASADGVLGRKEVNLIMRIAEIRANDMGIELTTAQLADLRRWAKAQDPDAQAMKAAIARMAKTGNSGDYEEVWSLVEIICEADGKVKPEEIEALREIRAAMDEEFAAYSG